MNPAPTISVPVDVTNPGQFFACCGLLELAHRLWPGAEGWFVGCTFAIRVREEKACLDQLVAQLQQSGLAGELTASLRQEREALEAQKRELKKQNRSLETAEEARRKELGTLLREGSIAIGEPFNLLLDWWQEDDGDVPKTFAGRQEVLRIACAMLSELSEAALDDRPLDYRCVLRPVGEESQQKNHGRRKGKGAGDSKVEPFYFDAQRFAHALDAGFSLDVQEKTIRASAAPLAELLALIGLQRFRPRPTRDDKWMFEYFIWQRPLGVAAATAVACGTITISARNGYRFRLQFRDDQKRYKAFGLAIPIGGDA